MNMYLLIEIELIMKFKLFTMLDVNNGTSVVDLGEPGLYMKIDACSITWL